MSATPSSDLAYRVLRLEQQLDSYQRLHGEELQEIRRALAELKDYILKAAAPDQDSETTGGGTRPSS